MNILKKGITSTIATGVFLFLFLNSTFAQKKSPDKILANKIYTIELTVKSGKKAADPVPDEISFKSDKIGSKVLKDEFEINPSNYTVTVDSSATDGTSINFESEGKNSSDEVLKWEGSVTGENIEGTAVLTNKKGKVKSEFSFTGTLKGKKKK